MMHLIYAFIVFLAVLPFSAYAQEHPAPFEAPTLCADAPNQEETIDELKGDLNQISTQGLPKFAVTEDEMKAAPCQTPVLTTEEVNASLEALSHGDQKYSKTIHGVQFEDESQKLLDVFQNLTTATSDMFHGKVDQKDFQNLFAVNPSCKKVLCAAKRIFGPQIGPKLLYLNQKYGMNASHYAMPKASAISEEEVNIFFSVLSDYPSSTFPHTKNQRMVRYQVGMDPPFGIGDSIFGNASMEFSDLWANLASPQEQKRIVSHELAHTVSIRDNLFFSQEWLSISGWHFTGKLWEHSNISGFPSSYAKESPAEDFAESATAYRYAPAWLKKVSPQKYQFMKEVLFQGLEYTSEEACRDTNRYENQLVEQLQNHLPEMNADDWLKNSENLSRVLSKCQEESIQELFTAQGQPPQLDDCIHKNLAIELTLGELNHIQPPLMYKDLASLGLRHSLSNTNLPPIPNDFLQSINTSARNQIQETMIGAFVKRDKKNSFMYSQHLEFSKMDLESFCAKWSNYANQDFDEMNKIFPRDRYSKFSIHYSEPINRYAYQICQKIHGSTQERHPLTLEQIREAVE